MNQDLSKRIIEDIHKTGFLSELKVSSTLIKHNWNVEQNSTYIDKELGLTREIDVVSYKCYIDHKNKVKIFLHLIIEVKKSKRPWVIFTQPNDSPKFEFAVKGPGFSMIHGSDNFSLKYLSSKELMVDFMRNEEDRIGKNYYEAFKSPDEPSKIFEAIMSSIKASVHNNEINYPEDEKEENGKTFNPKEYWDLAIFIPLIVLNGELFDAHLDEKGDVNLLSKDYIPMTVSYSSKKIGDLYSSFYPEIVTLKGLDHFIERSDNWASNLLQTIIQNINKDK